MKMIIISYINILAMLVPVFPAHSMMTKETKTLSVFSLEHQKINKLTCGPMTFIDFSGDDVDVPADVCCVIFICLKIIFIIDISTFMFSERLQNTSQSISKLKNVSVTNPNYPDIENITKEELSYLGKPILASYLVTSSSFL